MKLSTQAQKIDAYQRGNYVCPVPGGPTIYWEREDWINYIDSCEGWRGETTLPTQEQHNRLISERWTPTPNTSGYYTKEMTVKYWKTILENL